MAGYWGSGYWSAQYFDSGFFSGEGGASSVTYADAALVVLGQGSASLAGSVVPPGLPATPLGGSSGLFGTAWRQAERRRFVDAAMVAGGLGSCRLRPTAIAAGALFVVVRPLGKLKAATTAAIIQEHDDLLWLLAA